MEIRLSHLDEIHTVHIVRDKDSYIVVVDNKKYVVKDFLHQGYHLSFDIDGKKYAMYIAQDADRDYLFCEGEYYNLERIRAAKSSVRSTAVQHASSVSSPMPGLLVKLPVSVGAKVSSGQTLAIVEAMKMQNELRAPRDGVVEKIHFKEGDQVDAFQSIVELEQQ